MNHLKKIMMLVLVSIIFISCNKDDVNNEEPSLLDAEKTELLNC
ncbi:hypothetical protein [Lacinutrix jangbogonensis]|nr:hypothetical protein [Lacinutrix jangbogonensis]